MRKCLSVTISAVLAILLLTGCSLLCKHEYTSSVTVKPTYATEGETTYVCSKCGHTYTEPIEKLVKHVIPESVLDAALSKAKYSASIFSISVGELINSAMKNYKIKYLTGEEAVAHGYLTVKDHSLDLDKVYYAVISGDTKVNPDIPYLTYYEEKALRAVLIFDDNDELINYNIYLCSNLETYAAIMMSKTY